ncbi:MAG TPA: SGNH/GDSL hydrolase family protein [Acetobacteraceae bacterium]|nr:SGNH/GDSL hydrolase family protein [Acetobacteraceae bacterium]
MPSFRLHRAAAMLVTAVLLWVPAVSRAQPVDRAALPHVAARLRDGLPLRIVAFGSSSTKGVGASSPSRSYPSRLAADLARALPHGEVASVENRGIGGEDADDMIRRLPAIIAARPDLVIWQTGSNDPLRHLPLPRFIAETARGVRMMRAAGIDVILMEPQWCRRLRETAGSRAYTLAVRAVAASFGVPVVRRHALMQVWLARGLLTPAQMLAPDGLHMTDGGYAMLARVVARAILGAEPASAATPRLITAQVRPGARPVAP